MATVGEDEHAFDAAMMQIYTRARDEAGYNASRYLQMLVDHRGVETARILVTALLRWSPLGRRSSWGFAPAVHGLPGSERPPHPSGEGRASAYRVPCDSHHGSLARRERADGDGFHACFYPRDDGVRCGEVLGGLRGLEQCGDCALRTCGAHRPRVAPRPG